MKKIKIPSEVIYLLSIIIMAFSVAMLTAVDFGISMIVAPAYLISQKLQVITFGQAEYIVQGVLFIVLCIILRSFKLENFSAFICCLIYGLVLDLFRLIPVFNPDITPTGSMDLWVRIVFFVLGMTLTSFAVALSFKAYLYPQVYDFFVKGVCERYSVKSGLFKTCFDLSFLILSVVLSFAFFGELVAVNWGTIVMALLNGSLISLSVKFIEKYIDIYPLFGRFSERFKIEKFSAK